MRQEPRQDQKEPGLIKKKNPDKVRQGPRQDQKEPGLIKKEPRQGAARTKTRSERTQINQKTTRMRNIQVQKEPGTIRKQP